MERTARTTAGILATGRTRPPMRPRPATLVTILLLAAAAGCSQPGPFLRRQTTMGALKSSVAQLESEKEQLAKQLAEQKSEYRRIESQLAELDAQNGDLSARLDDARAVIGRQGFDDGQSLAPSRSASAPDRAPTRRASPARSAPSRGRKTPFTQIPNERRTLDESDEDLPDDGFLAPSPRGDRDEFGPQGRLDDQSPWMPVARGATSPSRRAR